MQQENNLPRDTRLIQPKNLTLAISAILAAPAASVMAQDTQEESGGFLEEVLVTATKREESMQNLATSIQAISAQQIEQAGMKGMEDYVRFVPSLNIVQANPGTAKVIFRGIADAQSTFIAEPSAAVYLDEQSLVVTGQPNPRMVDIERVEALSGPQGTLFGASAQSGVLRIITNKPDPEAFDANVSLDLSSTKSGDMSYDVSGMVNIPVSDDFAVRLVGFNARDGGFIDNVLGVTAGKGQQDNSAVLVDDFNEVDYTGGRIAARWFANDDWTVTAGIVYQKTDSKGRPEHDPEFAGELNVVRFKPEFEYDDQDWTQYSLTVEGDMGFAEFVSATSYFTRDWEYTQDTSVGYAAYFGSFCYSVYVYTSKYCFQPEGVHYYYNDPTGYLKNTQHNWKFSQEFRMVHQGETIDWVAGLFYEKSHEDWQFSTFTDGYDTSQSMANHLAGRVDDIPTRLADDTWWYSADDTDWEQYAVFGEMTWHATEKLDITAGYRWFDRTMNKEYFVELPKYNLTPEGVSNPTSDETDGVPKFAVSYQMTDDNLVYGLYSEGFRPGGTNRNRGVTIIAPQYNADKLENFEIGTKNTFAGGNVRFNATYFDMKWKDYQLEVVDPGHLTCGSDNADPVVCGQPWQKVVGNIGNASSRGLELQLDVASSENFTWGANATFLDAQIDEDVEISLGNVVPAGSPLPLSPDFKGSAYAQYNWPTSMMGAHDAWMRLQWSYTGSMLNQVEPLTLDDGPSPQLEQSAYNIGDLRFGLDADNWSMQLYVSNITDERATLFANPYELEYFFGRSRETVNRPRTFGVRWIQRFGN
jgi:iron complex outermembrane receptor protein